MTDITLKRSYIPHCTLGVMEIYGLPFYTIEKPWINNITYKSCIPEGSYKCVKYSSRKFPDVWKVLDVPRRTQILLHIGNYTNDVEGCIAVGLSLSLDRYMVVNSSLAFNRLREMLPDEFQLHITNSDKNTWL